MRRVLVLVLASVMFGSRESRAQTTAVSDPPDSASAMLVRAEFLRNFTGLHQKMEALATAIPADKFSWRPGPGVRSVAEVYQHLLTGHYRGIAVAFSIFNDSTQSAPSAIRQPITTTDKAELVRHLQEVGGFLKDEIGRLPTPKLTGSRSIYSMPRTIIWASVNMIGETHEHLGQLIAYARVIGVVPPWSQ